MILDARNRIFTIKNYLYHVGFQATVHKGIGKVASDDNWNAECFPKENIRHFVKVDTLFGPLENRVKNKLSISNANEEESVKADDEAEEIMFNVCCNFSKQ